MVRHRPGHNPPVGSDSGDAKYCEVSISQTAKLVVIQSEGEMYLRLRQVIDGIWKFRTPALRFPPEDIDQFTEPLDDKKGYPIKFKDEKLGPELNLLLYRGLLYVDFGGEQMSVLAKDFIGALQKLHQISWAIRSRSRGRIIMCIHSRNVLCQGK